MTDGRPLTAAEPSPPGRKVIALDVDDPVFIERNLQQFIDGLVVAEAVEREPNSRSSTLRLIRPAARGQLPRAHAVERFDNDRLEGVLADLGNQAVAHGVLLQHVDGVMQIEFKYSFRASSSWSTVPVT
jgi:hypothetical protein